MTYQSEAILENNFESIIVFTGSSESKTEVPLNVIDSSQLIKFLVTWVKRVPSRPQLKFCVVNIKA